MFNKLIYSLLILAFSGTFLTAQTQQTRIKRKSDKIQQQEKNAKEKIAANKTKQKDPQMEINNLMRRDPRLPEPDAGNAKQKIEFIRKNFVSRNFPRKVQNFRKGNYDTASILQSIANSFKKDLAHPDLEEATEIRLSWYNQVGTAFVALYQHLDTIERSAMMRQEKKYLSAALKYMEMAKRLEKILDKPEKISPGELAKIKGINTERRKQEIKKKITELMRQRRQGQ